MTSDVDLLGIVDQGRIHKEVAARGTSLYNYPFDALVAKSQEGDLFLLHLVSEGVVLHDTAAAFERVRDAFAYKLSYSSEIREASAIIWYFLDRPQSLSVKRARKRAIWALRTILISNAAQQKKAIFSSAGLEEYSGLKGLKATIDKRFTVHSDRLLTVAYEVVREFGRSKSELELSADRIVSGSEIAQFGSLAASTPALLKARRPKPSHDYLSGDAI